MPTVFRVGAYRFFFYGEEGGEPAHVHVERESNSAKFWLANGELARSRGFRGHELAVIAKLVAEHKATLTEAWNVHFPNAT